LFGLEATKLFRMVRIFTSARKALSASTADICVPAACCFERG
jgi:hypothetical protein